MALAASILFLAADCLAVPKTEVLLNFDTEDYTCDYANDAIRDLANILTEEGVTGQFFVVGYLAQRLQHFGRKDVIDALKPHVIGSQTLYHSRHPALCEYTDVPDASQAYRAALREEAECVGMLKAVFDLNHVDSLAPPGNSVSYAGMEAYADLGIRFYAGGSSWGYDGRGMATGTSGLAPTRGDALGMWYFNMYQIPYLFSRTFYLEQMLLQAKDEPDYKAVLDRLAGLGYCGLYMHPNQAVCRRFWDDLNYREGKNARPWGKWMVSPPRTKEETAAVYRRLRCLIRALKADSRFHITNLREIADKIKPRREMTPADIPAIKRSLENGFGPVSVPASYSVADVFQGAVRFLRGENAYMPGKAYGFLSPPKGIGAPVRVRVSDLRMAAQAIDFSRYLPSSIRVGGTEIGPADFLFATLDALTSGTEEVAIAPRQQLGSFAPIAHLENFKVAGTDKWIIHSPEFKDEYLSDRLRLQLWTLRYE